MIDHQRSTTVYGCAVRFMVCIGTLLVSTTVSARETQQTPPPALVRVGQVQLQSLQIRQEVIGRLKEVRRAVVASEQPGRVIEVLVEEGEAVVEKTTVLARIDDIWARIEQDATRARLQQAKAGLAEAQAQLQLAQRDREYLDGLLAAGSAKPKEAADAHTTEAEKLAGVDRAEAEVLAAEAELNRSHEQLVRLTVSAPFDGWVIRKMTEVGQWVNQGDPVAEIISRGMIDAVVDVPEAVINQVEVDSTVEVYVEPLAEIVTGRVVVINPSGSPTARTFRVKIRIDDQQSRLKPGMSLLAMIPTSKRASVLTVPRDAVNRSDSGTMVWAELGGVAVPVPVNVLFGEGDRYAIHPRNEANNPGGSRLTDQTNVVVEGAERLFPRRPLLLTKERGSG